VKSTATAAFGRETLAMHDAVSRRFFRGTVIPGCAPYCSTSAPFPSRSRISNRQNLRVEILQLVENTALITVLIAKDLGIRVFRETGFGMKLRRRRGPKRVRCSVSQLKPGREERNA